MDFVRSMDSLSRLPTSQSQYKDRSEESNMNRVSSVSDTMDRDELLEAVGGSSKHVQRRTQRLTICPRSVLALVGILGLATLLAILLSAVSYSGAALGGFSTPKSPDILRSPCGNSAAQAQALGCHFDIITFSWLPDRCYDAELSYTFDALASWEYYIDHNKTQPVEKAEALTGEYDGLYVSWEYHIQHCVYMWEKMHRALLGEGKRAVDGYIGPLAHTRHCGMMLTMRGEGFEFSDFNTRIRVKYPDCGIA